MTGTDLRIAVGKAIPTARPDSPDQAGGSRRRRRSLPKGTALVLILLAGALLRFWALDAVGFNSDEAVYAGQAASIAGDPAYTGLFPVFRAHPLLFQTVLSLTFLAGVSDVVARVLSVLVGLATVLAVRGLGRVLYGPTAGLVAALFVALMPYHVIVTRQVLLDGPATLFGVLAAYCVARYVQDRDPRWFHAAAAVAGLSVISKETSVVVVAALFVFVAISREVSVRRRDWIIGALVLGGVASVHPLVLHLTGRSSVGNSYVVWQFFRRANHDLLFYVRTVPGSIGLLVIVLGAAGLWLLRGEHGWRERLLLCWIVLPVVFFELWPVKGFQYLLVVAPAVAVLAARAVVRIRIPSSRFPGRLTPRALRAGLVLVVAITLVVPAWSAVDPTPTGRFLAGSGGVPGAREAGQWIDTRVPLGARFLTIGPSMANLVQFYGHRPAVALAVSPNPATRNPVYEAIENPDRRLRDGEVQYIVWDTYSAARSPFFTERLLRYAAKYHATVLHTESVPVAGPDGAVVPQNVITIYEVHS